MSSGDQHSDPQKKPPTEQSGGLLSTIRRTFRSSPTPIAIDSDGRKTFLENWATLILCITLFLLPVVLTGTVRALKVYKSDIRQWLPDGFEESKTYDDFLKRFGGDEMIVISWEDCTIDNLQVRTFQEALENVTVPVKTEVNGVTPEVETKLFSRVLTCLLYTSDAADE